jgi:hypothetical protein
LVPTPRPFRIQLTATKRKPLAVSRTWSHTEEVKLQE